MKVFVTGTTGHIGGSVSDRLVQSGFQVSGLVRTVPIDVIRKEDRVLSRFRSDASSTGISGPRRARPWSRAGRGCSKR